MTQFRNADMTFKIFENKNVFDTCYNVNNVTTLF